MRILVRAMSIGLSVLGFSLATLAQTPAPSPVTPAPAKVRTYPFKDLGSALPLRLQVPGDYVSLEAFKAMGVIVLCAESDIPRVKPNGDFSGAERAVISLRQSPTDHYDPAQGRFSLESQATLDKLKAMGASKVVIRRCDARGVPALALTYEAGARKIYTLAIADGSALLRLSYNARTQSREVDDQVWEALVAGL